MEEYIMTELYEERELELFSVGEFESTEFKTPLLVKA